MLFWITLANICMALSYVFLSAWVGVAIGIVSTCRTIGLMILDKYRDKTPRWLDVSVLIIFLLANCVATYLTWSILFEFVVLGAAMLGVYGFWSRGKHTARICTTVFSSVLIVYNILVSNWIAIAVEVAVLISVIVYYARRLARNNKKLLTPIPNDTINHENTILSN